MTDDDDIIERAQQTLMEQGICECPQCGRLHHKLANRPPVTIAGSFSSSRRPNDALRELRAKLSGRLNDRLCDMKEGWDDSIVGFNEARDIVRTAFDEALS